MTQTINGTNGNDTINGTNKGDTIYAKGGNDTVNGGNGNDFIDAGSGNDTVNAGNGDDEVHGGTGNDTINGDGGDDLIDGDSGDDIIKGGAGCDVICGGDGNDTITGGTGNDLINGGAGTDTAIFAGTYASYDLLNLYGLVLINGQDGTDLVLDVEFLKFDNGIYNVATHAFTPNTPAQPLVSVVATDGVGTEAADGTDFTYTFKRTGDLTQALTVNYTINPAPVNGATPGVDLQPVTGTITFAAGSNTAVLQFNAIDDAIVENTETFSVVVGTGAGYQVDIPNATAAGSIIDNDFTPAVVSLTPATVTTTEGGALTFTFSRAGGNLAGPLTINYVVNDGGPLGGATRADGDFSYASGMQQITFAAGQTSASITVQSNEDTKFEGTESFSVLLAGGVNYTADPVNNGSTGVILDNDPAPLVSVVATDGVGTETIDGTDFTFTFSRTGNTSSALTVNYSINPAPVDGATPGADFPAQTGTITFAAGSSTAVLQFSAIDDAVIENTELFSVVVGVGTGYQVDIPNATAGASILDNDFTPAVVSLTPATVTTTEGGALTFTFSRAGGNLAGPLTINYVVNDGGPAGGATRADGDFSYASGMQQITFAAGQTSASITVQSNEDTKFEGTESFSVLLVGGVNYTADPVNNGSTGVILDNDPAPLVSVVATDGVGTETIDGTDFTFTFSRTGNTSGALTVNYTINPAPVDGATPGADFPAQTGTITFAAGSSTAVLQFSAIDDAVIENTELFSVVVGVGTGYQVDIPNATAGASILDNDFTPAVVSLTPGTVTTTEGGALTFTFSRSGGNLAGPLTINYVVNDGGPAGGATRADGDFSYASGMQQITFAAGQTSASITVQSNEDTKFEGTESFSVLLAGGLDYTADPVNNGSTGVILDNDPAPLVAVVATDGAGTETIDGTDFTFTFSRTGDTSGALTVNYSIFPAPVDGATPGADFPAQTGTITFAAGSSTAVLQFSAIDDAIIENTELFSVVVGVGTGYQVDIPNATAGGSITDNDFTPAVVSLTPATNETTEGGSLAFTFTRSGGNLAAALTINYVVNDGGPLGGATRADGDFSYASGMQQLTFAAGQTTATITVVTNDDANVETDESFSVLLAGGVDYTADPVNNGSTGIIHDNDVAANPLVSVAATDGAGTETVDGTDFIFTFSRTGSTAAALTVTYTIQPAPVDGATPGADFPAQTGTITFAAGSATAVLSFDAIHDAVVENTEFFSVVVGAGAGYDVDTPNATANASIADGTIVGTNAAETLTGTNDPDAILGLGGDDGLIGGLGADYLDGGAGFDRTIYTNAGAAVNIQLAAGTATIGAVVDTLRSIEFARGTAFNDIYNATGFGPASTPNGSSEGNNLNGFEGLGGNDQITGNGNTRAEYTSATAGVTVTFLTGNSGNVAGDTSVGTDTLNNIFSVRGSQFDDTFINFGTTNNTFDGQGGVDTVSYVNAGAGVLVNLQTGQASGGGGVDVLRDNLGNVTIENAIGSGFNDSFVGSGTNTFDGGFGSDTVTLNNAVNNTLTAIGVETINGGAGNDTVTFVLNDGSVNQTINAGGGADTLNLAGTSTSYSLTLNNYTLVNGHGGTVNDNMNVLNQVAGTNFDFGAGNADELHVAGSAGVNVFTVNNIENVFGALATPDQIHIGGNSGGTTTVTAGGGPDQLWASSDADHFRFITTSDSSFDVPFAGQRDQIHDFDAAEDAFVFDHIAGLNPTNFNWTEINFGGTNIVLVDIDGGGTDLGGGVYAGYEMAIEMTDQTGTLTNANFMLVV